MAGQDTGSFVITLTGLLWTPTGNVPFTQRVTVSVVVCPQKMPLPPPTPPPVPPVAGPDVPKMVCVGTMGGAGSCQRGEQRSFGCYGKL